MNIKKLFLAPILVLVSGAIALHAQGTAWETVSIPGICTFQMPPTMEIQSGNYKKITNQLYKKIKKIDTMPERVVVQQSGLNDLDKTALKQFCRVIVKTNYGSRGDHRKLDEPLVLLANELQELDKTFDRQTSAVKGLKVLSSKPTKIVRLNSVDAILKSYTRCMEGAAPVIEHVYQIQNNDCSHSITVSFRESESGLWAADLEKIIISFKFIKR